MSDFCPTCGNAIVSDNECRVCDSDCISVSGAGDLGREYTFDNKFDPDDDNIASCSASGLLAELPVWVRTPPSVQAYNSAAQAVADNSTIVVDLNSERYDNDTMHSTVTNNSRLTFITAGVYIVTFVCAFTANIAGTRTVYLRKNGKFYLGIQSKKATNSASIETGMHLTVQEEFEAGEYIEALARQDSGTSLNVLATRYSPILSARFTRPATS